MFLNFCNTSSISSAPEIHIASLRYKSRLLIVPLKLVDIGSEATLTNPNQWPTYLEPRAFLLK